MMKLYDYLPSQNAYKVRLLLSHLGIEYETVPVSFFEGAGKKPELPGFLATVYSIDRYSINELS